MNVLRKIRRWLWRWGLLYPACPGWLSLAREFVGAPFWQKDGVIGLPLQYTLLDREHNGAIFPMEATCEWSGEPISGAVPLRLRPDGTNFQDVSRWGVRCARCGIPIHSRYAGMSGSCDIPSCPPCRRAVYRVKEGR